MADEVWACSACRSINKPKAKACYKCRTPRDIAGVAPSEVSLGANQPTPTLARPPFHSTRGYALIACVLVLAVAALRVVSLVSVAPLIEAVIGGSKITEADLATASTLGFTSIGVTLLTVLVWAFWLSRVVTVMPALGLGYPPSTGTTAFVECLIPIYNFFRVPAILRDVTRRIAPADPRGNTLIAAAWIGLIGSFLLDRIGGFVIGLTAPSLSEALSRSLVLSAICAALAVVGAGFLVYLTAWIEAGITRVHDADRAASKADGPPMTAAVAALGATRGAPATDDPRLAAPEAAPSLAAPSLAPAVGAALAADGNASRPETLETTGTAGPSAGEATPWTPELAREAAASVPSGAGPHLRVRVNGETIEGTIDEEWETISIAELTEAVVAIRDGGGTVTLSATDETLATGLGRDAFEAVRVSGVPYTVDRS